MFIDASALCSILLGEEDAGPLADKIAAATSRTTSAVAVFETVRAVLREADGDADRVKNVVSDFLRVAEIRVVHIGSSELAAALDAMTRFGIGRHPAALNMGDCFAYACARTSNEPLLFKGDDFSRTDIERA